jgi:hypothetical protein
VFAGGGGRSLVKEIIIKTCRIVTCYTVSWWVRILNCIEEVPLVHSIEHPPKLPYHMLSVALNNWQI